MAKYDALERHLATLAANEWAASFAQIEQVLGFALPASARRYPAWWANQDTPGHSQAGAWQAAGWQTGDLDLKREMVRFRRLRPNGSYRFEDASPSRQSLAEEARQYSGIDKEEDLVREGLKALIEREAARRLARLGGSMPDFVPAPRQSGE